MIIAAGIILLSGGLFVAQRAESAFRFAVALDHELVFTLSWYIYIVSVVVVYLAHVYRNFLETGAPSIVAHDTQDFVDEFLSDSGAEE
jgi:hypothetical protein